MMTKKAVIKKEDVQDLPIVDVKKYLCCEYGFSPNKGFELFESDDTWVFVQD